MPQNSEVKYEYLTLQNLSKILDKYEAQLGSSINDQQFDVLKGLPFYNWVSRRVFSAKQTQTDFNHAIGLPQKEGRPYPLFDYELMLYDTLQD